MTNKRLALAFALTLIIGCGEQDKSDVIAEAGERRLTRAEFQANTGLNYDNLSAEERLPLLTEWIDMVVIEQEIARSGLRNDPMVLNQERNLLAQYYRAILLSRQAAPEMTDSLITEYYSAHLVEFKRPTDSYLIESFWCESEDSLNAFCRALQKADTANLKSGIVIWEGKWLASTDDLEPPLLYGLRAIQPGELTQVLPFGEGYRLVRLHEVYPKGAQLGLDAVRGEIRERLLTEQSQRRQERWENELRGRYQPKIMGESK